jgi:hypothetical protein
VGQWLDAGWLGNNSAKDNIKQIVLLLLLPLCLLYPGV